MKRREFITLLGGATAWPQAVQAQQSAMPVIGFLGQGTPETDADLVAALRKGLKEIDFVEGQNVAIDFRWPNGQSERLPELATDLVRRRVSAIAATSTPAGAGCKGGNRDYTDCLRAGS